MDGINLQEQQKLIFFLGETLQSRVLRVCECVSV